MSGKHVDPDKTASYLDGTKQELRQTKIFTVYFLQNYIEIGPAVSNSTNVVQFLDSPIYILVTKFCCTLKTIVNQYTTFCFTECFLSVYAPYHHKY